MARASSVAQSFRTVLHALNKYITAIPAMIIVVADEPFILDTARIIIIGIKENRNALTTMAYCPLAKENPAQTAKVAPSDAPDDMPVVYVSARGFFSMLCMATPQTAKADPARRPPMTRGRRSSHTT
ncbi:MAG: hypothetical protein J5674_04210 [Candidatus Methanomethylophilaceae archaeon]|nr:hypothetical protein [Candidatus Methanomethylophilaceae archaeon]